MVNNRKVGETERVYNLVSAPLTGNYSKKEKESCIVCFWLPLVLCAKFVHTLYYIVVHIYGFFKVLAAYDLGHLLSLSAYTIGFYAKLSLFRESSLRFSWNVDDDGIENQLLSTKGGKYDPKTSGVVLEDFDTAFTNKFYHSHLDEIFWCFTFFFLQHPFSWTFLKMPSKEKI
ncbi:PREDICTED: uncharacterized protein LOC109212095 [Nicotiana attenuata]|uniref:uncharacterized protein LOC109212095 n=1 Tax=Nicotiana attenuata TaxID=49451 RepID=UPI0009052A33|nr:PREDICTED: uncharacterized protein LOC109212095 [Nicotiana attenuata]